MAYRQSCHSCLFWSLLASLLVLASPALPEITFPTAVHFEKSIYFQKLDGEPVQIPAGTYEVQQGGDNQLQILSTQDTTQPPIVVQASSAAHGFKVDHARALQTPAPDGNQDRQHLLLWLPNGVAFEALGSYSGVFTRSTLTWTAKSEDGDDALTIELTKPIYFKTVAGDPQPIQPGAYDIILEEKGLRLIKGQGEEAEGIVIESSPLHLSTAMVLPTFDGDPNLSLLLIAPSEGTPMVAIGSHDGTYSRGWGNFAREMHRKLRAKEEKGKK